MKLFASSMFAGILAFTTMASPFASAKTVLSEIEKAELVSPIVKAIAPPVSPIDPDMDIISLEGIDLSVPLTQEEAAFLEETIMEVFNEFHDSQGIDLFAESVSVGTHAMLFNATVNATATTNNLRGNRKLERTHKGVPGPDINYCKYQSGPLKGQWIEGCEFDIDLYICCRCWLCQDDDWTFGHSWKPTRAPTSRPTLSVDDQMRQWLDDDDIEKPIQSTRKPTRKPTLDPTTSPTKTLVDLEEERGPEEPIFEERPRKPKPNAFDKDVLKKLKKSRFKRFNKLKKLRFRRGNN